MTLCILCYTSSSGYTGHTQFASIPSTSRLNSLKTLAFLVILQTHGTAGILVNYSMLFISCIFSSASSLSEVGQRWARLQAAVQFSA